MFKQLLPQRIDNGYRGQKVALWLFALAVLMKTLMSLNSIFIGRYVAGKADGIPLDTYPPAAAQAVVSLFAIWGLAQFVICLLGVLVLVRYRAFVPCMFTLLLFEHVCRKLIFHFMPIVRSGTPPGAAVNLVLLGLMVVGLTLSLWRREQVLAMTLN